MGWVWDFLFGSSEQHRVPFIWVLSLHSAQDGHAAPPPPVVSSELPQMSLLSPGTF
jgi:hypothetical protein